MRTRTGAIGVVLLLAFAGSSPAAEWFVATNGNDAAEGTNWATAKLTIQAGVDAAASNDTVWVSNGVYATGGGRAVVGTWPNRVAIDRAITVQSVNGPETTFIVGDDMRCAYVANGATLSGFTLTNGTTYRIFSGGDFWTNPDYQGGGALCEDSAIMSNCVLTGNFAWFSGGGSQGGVLNNCLLVGNSTYSNGGGSAGGTLNHCILNENHADMFGGGAEGGTLNDCVLASNTTSYGGGAYGCTLNRCLIQDNVGSSEGGGVFGGTLNQCVVSGNRSMMGGGAAQDAVLNNCLVVSNAATGDEEGWRSGGGARQCRLSNCTVAGNTAVGEGGGIFLSAATNCIVVGNSSSMGLGSNYRDTTLGYSCTTPDPGGTGNVTSDPQFVDSEAGDYHLTAGSPCIDTGDSAAVFGAEDLDGHPRIVNAFVDMGAYEHQAENETILVARPASTNVGSGGASGLAIGVTANVAWTAATNASWLAITSGESGTTNGTVTFDVAANAGAARMGTIVVAGSGLARTCTVVQAKNPAFTMNWHVATNGNDAAAGTNWATAKQTIQATIDASTGGDTVWVSNGVYATGGGRAVAGMWPNRVAIDRAITVRSVSGPETTFIVGDGMRCAYVTNGAVLSGFMLTNGVTAPFNFEGEAYTNVDYKGGGAFCEDSAILSNCVLTGNSANYSGGGSQGGVLNNCALIGNYSVNDGGGSSGGTLNRCVLSGNSAGMVGGGAYGGTLNNSLLTGNSASYGAGAGSSALNNCTVTGNQGWDGGGALWSTLKNCIVYWNAGDGDFCNHKGCAISNSCTTPVPAGAGNIGQNPFFADGSRLQANSPCIDAGNNGDVVGTTDLDGNRRIASWTVDMGAFEFQPSLEIWPARTNLFGDAASGLAIEVLASVPWTATTNAGWITITSGESGTTNGTVVFAVASNSLAAARTGAVLVAGGGLVRTCAVIQAAAGPFMALGPEQFVLSGDAANGLSLAVTANVAWTAATNVPWLTITAGASGISNGTVVFSMASNGLPQPRSGAIQVSGDGIARTCTVVQTEGGAFVADWHVATNGNDAYDGRTWTMAKRSIQSAVDAATNGSTVWVSNGVYAGLVAVNKGVTVRSANGAEATTIQGSSSRCVNLSNAAAVVSGFTLMGGTADWGAGAYVAAGVLESCIVRDNQAYGVTQSSSDEWGHHEVRWNTSYGGGVYGGTLRNCIIKNNTASSYEQNGAGASGGGTYGSDLQNCLVINNHTSAFTPTGGGGAVGGGCHGGTLRNCTISGNQTWAAESASGGGCHASVVLNSIVKDNTSQTTFGGTVADDITGSSASHSCSPGLSGGGNISADPLFMAPGADNYRLPTNSPCIDGGNNGDVVGTTDLDGNPRIMNASVDMGAFEFQPELAIWPESTNLSHATASGLAIEVWARVPWTASTNVPWLAITAGESGTTDGTVVFDVAANEGATLRAGTIAVTGGGLACTYTVLQFYEGQSTNGYYDWATGITNGQTNATDCAAGDGVPNLLKYATGSPDPMAPDDLASLGVLGGGTTALTFNRNLNASDLMLVIQGADSISNGAAWRGLATNVGGSWLGATNVSESGTGNPVECTVTDPVALQSNRFLRLRVTRP